MPCKHTSNQIPMERRVYFNLPLIFALMALIFLTANAGSLRPTLVTDRVLIDVADEQPVDCTQASCNEACQSHLNDKFNGAKCADGPGGGFCTCL